VNGAETVIAAPITVPGLAVQAARQFSVRVQAVGTGSTSLRARVWLTSGSEPTGWQVSAVDTTAALQKPGAIGVIGYVSSGVTGGAMTIAIRNWGARPPS
jgi:hypothetical protein